MKAAYVFAAIALMPGMLLMQAAGGATVGVVDFDRAVADTPEGKDAITKLTAFGNERRAAIEARVKEAIDLQERLRTQGTALNDAARTRLAQELQDAQTAVETMQEEAEMRLNEMQQQLLVPVEDKTAKEVSAYAAERGLRIVLNASVLRSGLVYVHDTADITTEIIRRIATDFRRDGPTNALFVPRNTLDNPSERMFQSKWLRADFLNLAAESPTTQAEPVLGETPSLGE